MEAAGIEPSQENDRSTTVSEHNRCRTLTAEQVRDGLVDTFRTDPTHNDNTFLHAVCEIYAKWAELPPLVRQAVEEWDSLPTEVRKGVETLLGKADEGQT